MRGRVLSVPVKSLLPQSTSVLMLLPVSFGLGAMIGRSGARWFFDAQPAQARISDAVGPMGEEAPENTEGSFGEPSAMLEATFPELPDGFQICDQKLERVAKARRAECQAATHKAPQHWVSFEQAESETIGLLQAGDFDGIGKYIACDAVDLSLYEAHCDADLIPVDGQVIEQVLEAVDPKVLETARWSREVPSPRNLQRSRLVSPALTLGPPWSPEQQPLEGKTLLLLQRQSDGKIYVSGVPITGLESPRAKPLN